MAVGSQQEHDEVAAKRYNVYVDLTGIGVIHEAALQFIDKHFPIEVLKYKRGQEACRRGHPFTGETRMKKGANGKFYPYKVCRECARINRRRRNEELKDKRKTITRKSAA